MRHAKVRWWHLLWGPLTGAAKRTTIWLSCHALICQQKIVVDWSCSMSLAISGCHMTISRFLYRQSYYSTFPFIFNDVECSMKLLPIGFWLLLVKQQQKLNWVISTGHMIEWGKVSQWFHLKRLVVMTHTFFSTPWLMWWAYDKAWVNKHLKGQTPIPGTLQHLVSELKKLLDEIWNIFKKFKQVQWFSYTVSTYNVHFYTETTHTDRRGGGTACYSFWYINIVIVIWMCFVWGFFFLCIFKLMTEMLSHNTPNAASLFYPITSR